MKKKDIIHLLDTYDLKFLESCRNHMTNPRELQDVLDKECQKFYDIMVNLINEKTIIDRKNHVNKCDKYMYYIKTNNYNNNEYKYRQKYIQYYE